MEEKFEDTKGR